MSLPLPTPEGPHSTTIGECDESASAAASAAVAGRLAATLAAIWRLTSRFLLELLPTTGIISQGHPGGEIWQ